MTAALLLLLAALLAVAPAGAEGEIYVWSDARGHVHATRELLEVPPEHRHTARARAHDGQPSRLQTFENPRPGWKPGAGAASAALLTNSAATLQIPFERRGTLMVVEVVLNDHVRAPFLVDTGASGISIPKAVVRQLGIRVDSDTPRIAVQTAGGMVSEAVIQLDSVQVGSARVEHLDALVNSSMELGLLGGSFFNNFVYQVDAAAQVITLRGNEQVRGGLTAEQWRQRFLAVSSNVARLETHLRKEDLGATRRDELAANLTQLGETLDELHRLANAAGVPRAWRD